MKLSLLSALQVLGKSTICNLLPRFYELQQGVITIDGMDIRNVTLKSLRRNIGIVQQDIFLFSDSVRENIAYGNPHASMEEIITAARLAEADAFINQLPDGYDSQLGERGVKLSGGQKTEDCHCPSFFSKIRPS